MANDEDRDRIVRQLEQLKRREAELRRALIVADHPALDAPIREVDGRVYGVHMASERLDAPLTKGEQKKIERIEKKLETAKAKRAELDLAIEELGGELRALREDRRATLEGQRDEALSNLLTTLAEHAPTFEAVGMQISEVIPELEPLLPKLREMAEGKVDTVEKVEPAAETPPALAAERPAEASAEA